MPKPLSDSRKGPSRSLVMAMALGFVLGYLGWTWDAAEHAGLLHITPGTAMAHLLMGYSPLLVLLAMAVWLSRSVGRLPAYGTLAAGFAAFQLHPVARDLALMAVPLWAMALALRRSVADAGLLAAGLGTVLVLGGGAVDRVWHSANPDVVETNMLLLPGHAVELAGWLAGLLGLAWRLAPGRKAAAGTGGASAAPRTWHG